MRSANKNDSSAFLKWRGRNLYYYQWLERIYKFSVRPNSRVLQIGCDSGHLLNSLNPSFGLGVDDSEDNVLSAARMFPNLKFVYTSDINELTVNEKFDYIVISNSIGSWFDIERVLQRLHSCCNPDTRILVTYYNHLWEGVLYLGSILGIRRPYRYQNWLSRQDIENFLYISGFDVIRADSYVMMPLYVPIFSSFCNYFLSLLPGLRRLNLISFIIARPMPEKIKEDRLSVSVIVPSRNEKGNIKEAIRRIPRMGKETEIIFVEGNSNDGTVQEIEAQIAKNPDKKITLLRQDGIGKGDAVRKGFTAAKGDLVIIQDADLTVPPEDLPKFINAYCRGKGEFINGSRLIYPLEKESMRLLNLIANKFFGVLFTWLLGQHFKDTLCGTKMISRKDYDIIAANRAYFGNFDPFGDFDLIFGAVKQNLKIVEVPVRYKARTYGRTNISRFRHGILLFRMSCIAFKKIKWLGGKAKIEK